MIVDLLVHLETAEGTLVEPSALMEAAQSAGLDGMVLSRSQNLKPQISSYQQAAKRADIAVFWGITYVTNRGLILAILPSGADDDGLPSPNDTGIDAPTAIKAVTERGGVTIALRPYDRDVTRPMGDYLFALEGLHACEVMSGRASEIANDLALEAASNLEMACVGTSGAQGLSGLGKAATLLRRPVEDETGLVEVIKSGDCWPIAFVDQLPDEARYEGRGRMPPRSYQGRHGDRRERGSGHAPRRQGSAPERQGSAPERRERSDGRRQSISQSAGRGGRGGERSSSGSGGRNDGRRRSQRSRSGPRSPMRVTSAPEHADRLPDDYGNRIRRYRDDEPPAPPDDIGNRLAPGERSPFHEVRHSDTED
ncbi:MAG: hypothetical protein KTR25_04845 [Myxococcales bacterium]|nr:hypothetical protein [Myxococcales bacterium]